jgi:hypothetical protein
MIDKRQKDIYRNLSRFVLTKSNHIIDLELKHPEVDFWREKFLKGEIDSSVFEIEKSAESIFDLFGDGDLVRYVNENGHYSFFEVTDPLYDEAGEKIGLSTIDQNGDFAKFSEMTHVYKKVGNNYILVYSDQPIHVEIFD